LVSAVLATEATNDEPLSNFAFNFILRHYTAAPQTAVSFNQMTRWVMTKEEHCSKIIAKVGRCSLTPG